jgi:hypothetical protein
MMKKVQTKIKNSPMWERGKNAVEQRSFFPILFFFAFNGGPRFFFAEEKTSKERHAIFFLFMLTRAKVDV